MSFSDKAKNVLDIAAAGLQGLETVGTIAAGLLGEPGLGEKIEGPLKVILAIVDSVRGGLDGSRSVEEVKDDLKDMDAKAKAVKDKIAAEIDEKFPA